jgi:deoxyinosine 3'endonuclease (endonuclease V)
MTVYNRWGQPSRRPWRVNVTAPARCAELPKLAMIGSTGVRHNRTAGDATHATVVRAGPKSTP